MEMCVHFRHQIKENEKTEEEKFPHFKVKLLNFVSFLLSISHCRCDMENHEMNPSIFSLMVLNMTLA